MKKAAKKEILATTKPETISIPTPALPDKNIIKPTDAPNFLVGLLIAAVGVTVLSQTVRSGAEFLLVFASFILALGAMFWTTARYRVMVWRFLGKNYGIAKMVGRANKYFPQSISLNQESFTYAKGFYIIEQNAIYDDEGIPVITYSIGNPNPWRYEKAPTLESSEQGNVIMKAKTVLATLLAFSWVRTLLLISCGAAVGAILVSGATFMSVGDNTMATKATHDMCMRAINTTMNGTFTG